MRLLKSLFVSGLLLSGAMVYAQADLSAGSSHFVILQGDKTVGSTEFSVTPTPAGYTIDSRGEVHLSKFSYSFTNSQNLDPMLNLVSDQITGTVNNSHVTFSAHADQTGREFQIDVNAKGQNTQNSVDRHRHLALLPDLDAAGYLLLTRVGMENTPISWVLIPKQNGLLVPTVYTRDAEVRGRLDGHDIEVQHTTVAISAQNSVNVELFYSEDGRLLEADLPEQNFYVVLDGFKLINRPKFAPPRSPEADAPPPQQNGAQQYSAPENAPQQQRNGAPQYSEPQGAAPPQIQQQ